jgi:hypothetical protein
LLELKASVDGRQAIMGDTVDAPVGTTIRFELHTVHVTGARAHVLLDGVQVDLLEHDLIASDDQHLAFAWTADGKRHTIRVEVRDAAGKLLLLGNPIYLEGPQAAAVQR